MKKEDAKVGDFVRLKKGGAEMQIVDIEVGLFVCRWLAENNQVETWGYRPDQLDLVRKGDGETKFLD